MTTFLEDESSAESNRPQELYVIALPTTTYYLTSGVRDVTVSSITYLAQAIARTEVAVFQPGRPAELVLALPVNHAIVRRYLEQGIPPRQISVTVMRQQIVSGVTEQIWYGNVTSLAVEGRVAKLRVPSRASESLLRVLPTTTAGRACPHVLYDTMCKIDRNSFKVAATVLYVNGRVVRVDMGASHGGDWSQGGEFVHPSTGERMTVLAQDDLGGGSTVADLTLQYQVIGMGIGDSVEIYAGCAHDMGTCNTKFSNRHNYGGFNLLSTKPVFVPGSIGLEAY